MYIFRMPDINKEMLEEALARVDREIGSETERENFRATIRKMYESNNKREVNEQ